ncbi:hypothetical protein BGZ94_001355 [Podila epigama]|nr:hypothetical protein BGZ94_001355 [Podila epigama]
MTRPALIRAVLSPSVTGRRSLILNSQAALRATRATTTRLNLHAFSTTATTRAIAGSSQALTPLDRSILATTRAIRNVLIFSTSTLALGYFLFSGTHAYLEQYKCPSPPGLSSPVRIALHGAWVREEFAPDPDVAQLYFDKAIELTRAELEEFYKTKLKNNQLTRQDGGRVEYPEMLAYTWIERDAALAEIQNRLARFYARIGQDEQAATIWTRLWRLSDRASPSWEQGQDQASSFTKSWFGRSDERALIMRQDGAQYAKSAADCWMRLGEYDLAEEALGWILSNRQQQHHKHDNSANTTATTSTPLTTQPVDTITKEDIDLWATLGALYVRQKKFDYALSLFIKSLQSVQAKRASLTLTAEDKNMWFCREAILMHSIGETLLGIANATAVATTSKPVQDATLASDKKKTGSSWKFWSSSSSSSSNVSASTESSKVKPPKSPELIQKEEEALGWMQKAIAMAKDGSGKHRDCDECAGLALNTLGLIQEMEGDKDGALAKFKDALRHATMANDYVGIDDYNKNVTRLSEPPATSIVSESAL